MLKMSFLIYIKIIPKSLFYNNSSACVAKSTRSHPSKHIFKILLRSLQIYNNILETWHTVSMSHNIEIGFRNLNVVFHRDTMTPKCILVTAFKLIAKIACIVEIHLWCVPLVVSRNRRLKSCIKRSIKISQDKIGNNNCFVYIE